MCHIHIQGRIWRNWFSLMEKKHWVFFWLEGVGCDHATGQSCAGKACSIEPMAVSMLVSKAVLAKLVAATMVVEHHLGQEPDVTNLGPDATNLT